MGCACSVTEHRPHGKEEQEIFDEQQGTREVWDRCVVTAYFAPDLNVSGAIQASERLSRFKLACSATQTLASTKLLTGSTKTKKPWSLIL